MNSQPERKFYDYAKDVTDKVVFIDNVESGRKGYFCYDCDREMIAYKGTSGLRVHYFGHDPKCVKREGKCSFSNETFRHKIAKEILQRIKKIKVPKLLISPPNDIIGLPYLLKESHFIEAESVHVELQFYENNFGQVCWGRNIDFENDKTKMLLIQPDVAFFNAEGRPILLIEIVATHKVNIPKTEKIYCLGIDTIEVSIPRSSLEEIEMLFFRTSNTKWIYNYEREHTRYIQISDRTGEGNESLDEFESRVLKSMESIKCRSNQIKTFIRRIRALVESQQFRDSKNWLTSEIQRVEGNSERERSELRELQSKLRARIEATNESENRALIEEEGRIEKEEREFRIEEDRIQKLYEEFRPKCQDEIDRIEESLRESLGINFVSTREINEYRVKLAERIRREKRSIGERREKLAQEEERFTVEETNFYQRFAKEEGSIRDSISLQERKFREGIEESRRTIGDRFRKRKETLRSDSEDIIKSTISAIERENPSESKWGTNRLKEIFRIREFARNIINVSKRRKLLLGARKAIENDTYKHWI